MPDNVAQSTSNNISGSGYNTRQRWRGSDSAEKWSRTEADRGRWGMASSESSKLPLNHILSAPPIPLTWGDCPGASACSTQHGYEKPIGSGPARGHQKSLRRSQRRGSKILRFFPQHGRGLLWRHHGEFRMPADKAADLLAVFRRQHRAGDIGDPAARLDQG